jgi:NAD dependent epimerase/dehydratase family enzyme
MKILITGSSGLIGSALVKSLTLIGHDVIRLLRTKSTGDLPFWDPEKEIIDLGNVIGIDAVINLAGYSLTKSRWNKRIKSRIMDSRIRGTRLLSNFFANSVNKPCVFISASGIGAYGNCGSDIVDEKNEFD